MASAGARNLAPGRLVVASHNAGKLREIGELLAPYGVETVSVGDFDLPVPEETETTFEGNAAIKALAAARGAGLPALSDDSGLCVDALDGDPGVRTADWAETPGGRDFGHAMRVMRQKLLDRAAPEPWSAHFVCVLCLAWPDGHTETFRGEVHGRVVWPPRGDRGFGYDPVFMRDGEPLTFGEIAPEAKHANSHRAKAFELLTSACFGAFAGDPPNAEPGAGGPNGAGA
ncbi:MAG: non-canonical purine NTP pyrophosphatase [Pseudomonadota bacterium]